MTNEERLNKICKKYEEKLVELMGEKEFISFSTKIAKDLFITEVQGFPGSEREFKDFVFDNLDIIFGENGTEGERP